MSRSQTRTSPILRRQSGVLGLAILACVTFGCNHMPWIRPTPPVDTKLISPANGKPDAASLVNYLNSNSKNVKHLVAQVDVQCHMNGKSVGVSGNLACQKPLGFRLKGEVLGKPAVDIGSNSNEFWYWISQDNPPSVNYCSYNDLAKGTVTVPFPFQPEMVLAALGIAEYDPAAKYELKEYPNTVELQQVTTALNGQPARRVTVFNRNLAKPGTPQVLAHALLDAKGKLICRAKVEKISVDKDTGATLPTKVHIEWPEQKLSLDLTLRQFNTNRLSDAQLQNVFSRNDLNAHESYDLARRTVVQPSGLRRASTDNRR